MLSARCESWISVKISGNRGGCQSLVERDAGKVAHDGEVARADLATTTDERLAGSLD